MSKWYSKAVQDVMRANWFRGREAQPDKPTFEQMKEVVELAEEFDRLQGLPVWEKLLRRMGEGMNAELLEAANKKYDRESRMMHCDMYHAKREALDDLQGWIESVQRERDRIIAEFKEIKYGRSESDPV